MADITSDATPYVRACEGVEALGVNPIWIPMVLASIFFATPIVWALTAAVIGFLIYAKRKGMKPFELIRRIRRIVLGTRRMPFRRF